MLKHLGYIFSHIVESLYKSRVGKYAFRDSRLLAEIKCCHLVPWRTGLLTQSFTSSDLVRDLEAPSLPASLPSGYSSSQMT